MTYSIWIIPPQPLFDDLNKIVYSLSQRYQGPVFKPHITLLSGIDAKPEKIKKVVETAMADTGEIKLSLGPISFSTTYYQSVLILVTPTPQLMKVNLSIKRLLGIENKPFFPHISLMYGDHDMETRDKIAQVVERPKVHSFTASELAIVAETPDVKDWNPILKFSLSK